jgi:nicotinate-nucleotide--dimethylbenzimidazole phosphoribosyltransferase
MSIPALDAAAMTAARARQDTLTKPPGALGRLEDLSVWLAGVQGQCPPTPFRRRRLVLFAGDHGVAAHGVSAYPAEVTGQMIGNFLAGGAACTVLARQADVGVRVLDIAVDSDHLPPSVTVHKVRRGSGAIHLEPALTGGELAKALAVGAAIADEEIDAGADLLIAGDMGIANTTVAAAVVAALTDSPASAVVGHGTGIDEDGVRRKQAVVSAALERWRPMGIDPTVVLRELGGADLAAMVGFMVRAAGRRTAIVLDGVFPVTAALVAEALAPGTSAYVVAGHGSTEPAQGLALERLGLAPLLDLGLRLGEGTGALLALPLLDAAIAILAEMATFGDAGVAGPVDA